MAEITETPVEQKQSSTPAQITPEVKEDLVSRVSKFKSESEKPSGEEPIFDYKEIEKIQDPTAKAIAEKAYKSMQSGFTKKFQEVADIRKSLEAQANEKKPWTAQRIQSELLNDPTFISQAQQLAATNPSPVNPSTSGMTTQEWSALTPVEQAKFQLLETKINQLEQQNSQAYLQNQHQALKSKYANYAPDIVDTTVREIMTGKQQVTIEDVWKAKDYVDGMRRAYEMGKFDALGKNQEKLNSNSFEGGNAQSSSPTVEAAKGESNLSFFQRIARHRLVEAQNRPRI